MTKTTMKSGERTQWTSPPTDKFPATLKRKYSPTLRPTDMPENLASFGVGEKSRAPSVMDVLIEQFSPSPVAERS